MCAYAVNGKKAAGIDNYFTRLIGQLVCFGSAISLVIITLNLASLGLLTSWIFLLFIAIDAGLIVLSFYLVRKYSRRSYLRLCGVIVAILMLCINLIGSSYLSTTEEFLKGQYTLSSSGYVEYHVIAQMSANVELSKNVSVRAGIQSTDVYKSEAEEETQKLADASFSEYDNLSELISATEDASLDIAVVQASFLESYAEYFPESYENLNILASFATETKYGQTAEVTNVDISKPFAIYVSGGDSYGEINDNARSDVNMLILIDPETYRMLLINTPRDYYVQLHGTTGYKDKLTHAGTYGIEMSESTMEDLYGLEIDFHVRINFTTLVEMVNAVGGIVVNNPTEFELWGQTYAAGEIYLDGEGALLFSRARKGLEHGDYDRGENQQRVIEALVDRYTDYEILTQYTKIINSLSGTFRSNIQPSVITQLFNRQLSLGGDWTIEKMSATGTDAARPTYSMGDNQLSVVIPDEASLDEIRTAVRAFMLGSE